MKNEKFYFDSVKNEHLKNKDLPASVLIYGITQLWGISSQMNEQCQPKQSTETFSTILSSLAYY